MSINKPEPVSIVAIGASAGGTDALRLLLRELPADFPPIVVVQHILPGFSQMLCDDINRHSQICAEVAIHGATPARGHAYFADAGQQLYVRAERKGLRLRLGSGEKYSGHCPSVDALFESVAESAAGSAVGVILTGMGQDGAKGLLLLREAGGYTIGQDERSSAIYGMPRAAFQIGAVTRQLALEAIPAELMRVAGAGVYAAAAQTAEKD